MTPAQTVSAPHEKVSASRTRRLITGVFSSALSRGLGVLAPLVVVPTAIAIYGTEVYGLWATLTAFTSMIMFADLGLGAGLMTRLAEALAQEQTGTARRLVSSAYALLVGIALLLVLVLYGAFTLWDFGSAFGSPANLDSGTTSLIIAVFLLAFIANIPLGLIQRIQYAAQRITYSNSWFAGISLASAGVFVVLAHSGVPASVAILCSACVLPIGNLINSLIYFAFMERSLRPWSAIPVWSSAASLLRVGILFFILSLLTSVSLNVDTVIVARVAGLNETVFFSVALRVSGFLALLIMLISVPLWPLNSDALARGDVDWTRRITRISSLVGALVVGVGGLLLVWLGPWFWSVWLKGSPVAFSALLMLGFGVWNVLLAITSPYLMVQNSVGLLWPQILGYSAFLLISIPAKLLLLHFDGSTYLPMVSSGAWALCLIPVALYGFRRALRNSPAGFDHPDQIGADSQA